MDSAIDLLRPLRFRGKGRILNRVAPRAGQKQAKVFGWSVNLDLSDYIQRSIYLGTFERVETDIVEHALKPGMTFVDVGANVGYFTLLAAQRVGTAGRVLSFEPSKALHARLAETVERNALSNVTLIEAGLGDREKIVRLYLNPSFANNSPTMVAHEAAEVTDVRVLRLDDFISTHRIDKIDLMKVDVEGYEPDVFAGAERALAAGTVRAVLCEFNDHWLRMNGSSPAQLWDTLISAGFRPAGGSPRPPRFAPGCVVNHVLRCTKAAQT